MTGLVVLALASWLLLSLLRLVYPYSPASPFQRWRRFDIFHLVPTGGFFSPGVPETSFSFAVRDLLEDGRTSAWMEAPAILPRRWWHLLWNPQKGLYRARIEMVRTLFATAAVMHRADGAPEPAFLLSEPYLALLRYASGLRRIASPAAVQFAAIETEIASGRVVRSILSAVHHV